MNYNLTKDVIQLLEQFDVENSNQYFTSDIEGFKNWVSSKQKSAISLDNVNWEGKETGRGAESVITTLLVHLNRYAKTYSKSAIVGSNFTTQEDFIYLITLKAFGEMTKTDLIKRNIHEKPAGTLIINRLLHQGWISQVDSKEDKRNKMISISEQGLQALDAQMDKIRNASKIVCGNLTDSEKSDLIRLLTKLDHFHHPIYLRNIDSEALIDTVFNDYSLANLS